MSMPVREGAEGDYLRPHRSALHLVKFLLFVVLALSLEAREVRVASFNVEHGVGRYDISTGQFISEDHAQKYAAISAVVARIDADIIGFQELYESAEHFNGWMKLADDTGYPYRALSSVGDNSSDSLRVGYFSRFPIISEHNLGSAPEGAELGRAPFRVEVEVPDAAYPLALWNMHFRSGSQPYIRFMRYVEAKRIVEDVNAYQAANPNHHEFIVLGDFNDDWTDSQLPVNSGQTYSWPINWYRPLPDLFDDYGFVITGMHGSHQFSVMTPVPYPIFPIHHFQLADGDLFHVDMHQTGEPHLLHTRWPSERILDYIFVSDSLFPGAVGEIYNSEYDGVGVGLPKAGSPPAWDVSYASDHLAIFVDIDMQDFSPVMPGCSLASTGNPGGPFVPNEMLYTVSNTNDFQVSWTVITDVDWLTIAPNTFALSSLASQDVAITINEQANLLLPGTHIGSVIFSNTITELVTIREVHLDVLDHLVLLPEDGLQASGITQGPFDPSSMTYVLSNKTPATITWHALPTPDWITVTPTSGTLTGHNAMDVTVSINAHANDLPIGFHEEEVVLYNAVSALSHIRPVTLDVRGNLCVALDNCDLVWTTEGDASWFYQTEVTFDGEDAAQSGALPGPGTTSWMETIVTGPATLSFQWRISSRLSFDFVRFQQNGIQYMSRSGEGAWQEYTHTIPSGIHTLRWEYARSSATPAGEDAAWVDQVRLSRLEISPSGTFITAGLPGGPFSPSSQVYTLTNNGDSAILWTAPTNHPWLDLKPAEGVIQPGEGTAVTATVTSAANEYPVGFHGQTIRFMDDSAGVSVQRPAQLNVMDYLIVEPTDAVFYQGPPGGPFTPRTQTYTLSNAGVESLSWTISAPSAWLSISATNGTLAAGATAQVEIGLNAQAYTFDSWTSQSVVFSNATSQRAQTQWHYLSVWGTPRVSPASEWQAIGPLGGPFTPSSTTYTITNSTGTAHTWNVSSTSHWLTVSHTSISVAPSSSATVTADLHADAALLPVGTHRSSLLFSNVTTGEILYRNVSLLTGLTLCESVDACELTWTTGGHAPWFPQDEHTSDGVDAAASGTITHNQESWIETTVTGPGTLSFHWKVSSEANYDFLEFRINGTLQSGRISGEVDWQERVFELPEGVQVLRWIYHKDFTVTHGDDRGWLDQVSWTPERTAMGVPTAWYQGFGILPANGQSWDALDHLESAVAGTPNWRHYPTGLDPTNETSLFEILHLEQGDGQVPYIAWRGGLYGPQSPYVIQVTTNPASGHWDTIGTSPRQDGTNWWTGNEPLDGLHIFRILAEP